MSAQSDATEALLLAKKNEENIAFIAKAVCMAMLHTCRDVEDVWRLAKEGIHIPTLVKLAEACPPHLTRSDE